MRFLKRPFTLVLAWIILPFVSHAQILMGPAPEGLHRQKAASRTQEVIDTLQLPFWDDFSTSKNQPNTSFWVNSQNVYINAHIGVNAPTIHVATFDGVDQNGRPYDADATIAGQADSLISKPIDLSNLNESERNSLYLSFFWQMQGLGELPDEEDSLRLEFRNSDGQWVSIWRVTGDPDLRRDLFFQEIIQINQEQFFHAGFQFRFQNFARLSGSFDNWHVDYIYLNTGRNSNDISYFDRALTTQPTSIFDTYTGIPMSVFRHPEFTTQATEVQINNLDNIFQPIEFSVLLDDTLQNQRLQTVDMDRGLGTLLQGFERRTITSSPIDKEALLTDDPDSLFIETTFYITSGDNFLIKDVDPNTGDTTYHEHIDLKVNDTTRSHFMVHDYLSYDDGTAEFSAGINQNGGKLAYQFYIPESDTLNGIDVYFPIIARSRGSESIVLYVWQSLGEPGEEDVFYLRQSAVTPTSSPINQFLRIEFPNPVILRDTFYIGYEQQTDNFLALGLDKNTDSGDRIFFNVSGEWERNRRVQGSLMMRPVFSPGLDIVVSLPEEAAPNIQIFPNPSRGRFRIQGEYDAWQVFDLSGRPVQVSKQNAGEIDLSGQSPGIYLLNLQKNQHIIRKKLILKP